MGADPAVRQPCKQGGSAESISPEYTQSMFLTCRGASFIIILTINENSRLLTARRNDGVPILLLDQLPRWSCFMMSDSQTKSDHLPTHGNDSTLVLLRIEAAGMPM